jgi:hypothetical protein
MTYTLSKIWERVLYFEIMLCLLAFEMNIKYTRSKYFHGRARSWNHVIRWKSSIYW